MKKTSIGNIILNSMQEILKDASRNALQKVTDIFQVFNIVLEESTSSEQIYFTTLFSRTAYVGSRYKIQAFPLHYIHSFRRANEQELIVKNNAEDYLALGQYVIKEIVFSVWQEGLQPKLDDVIKEKFERKVDSVLSFSAMIESIITGVDVKEMKVFFVDEADASQENIAYFDIADRNENFSPNIHSLAQFKFPVAANLLDVEKRENQAYYPKAIVIKPDRMVDVTAIAECFKYYGTEALLYIVNKFKPRSVSTALMIGNIANLFLDEIVTNPKITYKELEPEIFRLDPLGFSIYNDQELVDLIKKVKDHYLHLKDVISMDFARLEIDLEKVYLEPSFYSRDYGIQGRLDLLLQDGKDRLEIVELKSGQPFRPNAYGLSNNHYTQTLLYELLIRSTFGMRCKPVNYILYSALEKDQLRYAPAVKAQQFEAMKIRNDLIAIEEKIAQLTEQDGDSILDYLQVSNFPNAKGFNLKDIENFQQVYQSLNNLEKQYFNSFAAFIAREQSLSKTGEHGINRSNGLAGLWLETIAEKEDRYSILSNLIIVENRTRESVPFIKFERTEETNPLANFRVGDIAVMYPYDDNPKAVLRNQVFKCTILSISEVEVTVRLRSKQYNHTIFQDFDRWNIEEDHLDSGYNTMFRSLFEFASASPDKRSLVLGNRPPHPPQQHAFNPDAELTEEQSSLLKRIVNCQDYFLLWGPPGTGKTSMMIKHLAKYMMTHTRENVLFLAYTNRAVDEICESIQSVDPQNETPFIRLGSRYSCGPSFVDSLLDQRVEKLNSRNEVRKMIKEQRVFVSTISSIVNRTELFMLKSFDMVIIDEASQILEPMLVGLITRFKRFVLVGDHKQLPAVVRQNRSDIVVKSEILKENGISDLSMSLFERLYVKAHIEGWTQALGILSAQGRMHEEIMEFPNEMFYSGQLGLLDINKSLKGPRDWNYDTERQKFLTENRRIYIPTDVDLYQNWKTNQYEAIAVKGLVIQLVEMFNKNNLKIEKDSIGIITPYRAQIAMIKKELEGLGQETFKMLTVDTVERYQGGARDIIILSLCTNKLSQLDSLVSLSSAGVDRKLNVALTRARAQIIILGNEEILSSNPTYQKLIQGYNRMNLTLN